MKRSRGCAQGGGVDMMLRPQPSGRRRAPRVTSIKCTMPHAETATPLPPKPCLPIGKLVQPSLVQHWRRMVPDLSGLVGKFVAVTHH